MPRRPSQVELPILQFLGPSDTGRPLQESLIGINAWSDHMEVPAPQRKFVKGQAIAIECAGSCRV